MVSYAFKSFNSMSIKQGSVVDPTSATNMPTAHQQLLPEANLILCVCLNVYALHACSTQRGQERVEDSLELKLQVFESHHEDAGNEIQVLCKEVSAFNH